MASFVGYIDCRKSRSVRLATDKALDGIRVLIGCKREEPVVIGDCVTHWLDKEEQLKLPKLRFLLKGISMDFVGNDVLLGGDAEHARTCRAITEIVAMGVIKDRKN